MKTDSATVIISVFFGSLLVGSPGIRAAVSEAIIQWFDGFTKFQSGSSSSANNDDVVHSTFNENGIVYHVFESTDIRTYNSIMWSTDGCLFDLFSMTSVDVLKQIALSVSR